jgi:uncharacterized protein (DUF1697 family)
MIAHIALLRAVNLGPHNKIGMGDLRELAVGLGLLDARTVLQTGNLVFRSDTRTTCAQLEQQLERAAFAKLDLDTDVFVRTAREWGDLIVANPFPREAKIDPAHLVAVVLRTEPDRAAVAALQKSITGRELVRAAGRCTYVFYPDGIGRSRLTNVRLEKALGSRGTARNWNTVLKLAAVAST